jgi:hypothetical protein
MQQQYCIVRDYCCKSVILSLWIRDPVVIVGKKKKCQCQVGFGLGGVSVQVTSKVVVLECCPVWCSYCLRL